MLRQTISQSVSLGVKFTLEPVTKYYILSESCCVVSVGCPLYDERSGLSPVSHCHQCLVHCQRINIAYIVHVEVKVTLRPTISRPVRLGVRRPSGIRDQFFFLLEIFF
jgi:hypothetical protein